MSLLVFASIGLPILSVTQTLFLLSMKGGFLDRRLLLVETGDSASGIEAMKRTEIE
jgi:hypothetical protein